MHATMVKPPLRLAVLGSTGSLGQTVLAVARSFGERVRIVGLGAGANVSLLAQQTREHRPQMASFARGQWPSGAATVPGLRFVSPREMIASPEVDMVVVATAGRASLLHTWAAVEAGKRVAVGNLDVLLMAGPLLTRLAADRGAQLFPLDDEPAGVWQCLWGEESPAEQVTITSTWGTLRARRLSHHGPHVAVRPSRRVGQKRGIDAATLMTKATQVAAVHYLYGVPLDRIQVLFHPESLVRALVEFQDGSVKAVLSQPDMRVPIQLALSYPERWSSPEMKRVDLLRVGRLSFEPLEEGLFPSFRLALTAMEKGGTYPAALVAANEAATDLFLSQQIGLGDIPVLIERALRAHQPAAEPGLEEIAAADEWARAFVGRQVPE